MRQQLFRDGTSEFLRLLQERIDQQREENIEEARDEWLDGFEQGKDRTARDLRPNWPEKQLKVLDERIAVCRAVQRKVQPMLDENDDEVEGSKLGFEAGPLPGEDYVLEKFIDSGAFGEVWQVKNHLLEVIPWC